MAAGVEMLVGVRRDPVFGPVLVVGMGGIDVEAQRDVSVRPLPVTAADVRAMIGELRGGVALGGGRGRPPADVDALVAAALALARFLVVSPVDVVEAEVNPLMVGPDGAVAVDALVVREIHH